MKTTSNPKNIIIIIIIMFVSKYRNIEIDYLILYLYCFPKKKKAR